MEHKIGEIFKYNGEWYQCVEGDIYCPDCVFFRKKCNSQVLGECGALKRSDKENVIFKKLEKVGESYTFVDKTVQNYLLETEMSASPEDVFILTNNELRLIAIEIKQNKEDMSNTETLWYGPDKKEAKSLKLSNLKPFSLEAAKAGKPVCTRDGRKVRIICFDAKRKDERNIIAVIPSKDYPGFEDVIAYPNNGNYHGWHENDGDLMMLLEKKEGWVNVYKDGLLDTRVYNTKKEAFDKASPRDYVDTVRISWEESE